MITDPKSINEFYSLYQEAFKEGSLSEREKLLIALGTCIGLQNQTGIKMFSEDAGRAGLTEIQLKEAIEVGEITKKAVEILSRFK